MNEKDDFWILIFCIMVLILMIIVAVRTGII